MDSTVIEIIAQNYAKRATQSAPRCRYIGYNTGQRCAKPRRQREFLDQLAAAAEQKEMVNDGLTMELDDIYYEPFCDDHRTANDTLVFQGLCEHFHHLRALYWTRANIFVIVEGAIIAAAFTLLGSILGNDASNGRLVLHSDDRFLFALLFGMAFLLSLLWVAVSWTSISWIKKYRNQLRQIDPQLDRFRCFQRTEDGERAHQLTATKAVGIASVLFMVVWLLLIPVVLWAF